MLRQGGEKRADGTWFSPSAERNKGPILDVLARVLPGRGVVLEIASGTGQHVIHFAKALPNLTWRPSDPDAEIRESIAARVRDERLANVNPPVDLDVTTVPWPLRAADAVVCINMIHVAPWSATLALFEGAKALLPARRTLFLYGPYRRFGGHTSESNARFDSDLRARNPEWGLRDVEAVTEVAARAGFVLAEIVEMPANNLSLVFERRTEVDALMEFFAAINRNDMQAMSKDFDPRIVRVEPEGFPTSGTYRGIAEVREHVAAGRGTWAEGSCEPERFLVKADKVVVYLHVRVRLKDAADWIDARFADGFAFGNGKITEYLTFARRDEALEWAGIEDHEPS